MARKLIDVCLSTTSIVASLAALMIFSISQPANAGMADLDLPISELFSSYEIPEPEGMEPDFRPPLSRAVLLECQHAPQINFVAPVIRKTAKIIVQPGFESVTNLDRRKEQDALVAAIVELSNLDPSEKFTPLSVWSNGRRLAGTQLERLTAVSNMIDSYTNQLFQTIEKSSASVSGQMISASQRLLESQLIPMSSVIFTRSENPATEEISLPGKPADNYWQYYEDCDSWDVKFSKLDLSNLRIGLFSNVSLVTNTGESTNSGFMIAKSHGTKLTNATFSSWKWNSISVAVSARIKTLVADKAFIGKSSALIGKAISMNEFIEVETRALAPKKSLSMDVFLPYEAVKTQLRVIGSGFQSNLLPVIWAGGFSKWD